MYQMKAQSWNILISMGEIQQSKVVQLHHQFLSKKMVMQITHSYSLQGYMLFKLDYNTPIIIYDHQKGLVKNGFA